MLEPVQQREHDAVGDGEHLDPLERRRQRRRLHGDDEQRDGMLEPLDRLGARLGHDSVVDECEPTLADHGDGLRRPHADGRRANSDHAPNASDTEDGYLAARRGRCLLPEAALHVSYRTHAPSRRAPQTVCGTTMPQAKPCASALRGASPPSTR